MTKLIPRFPDGATGVALVLIRISCAASALTDIVSAWNFVQAPFGVVAGAALFLAFVAGALTRAAGLALAVKLLFDLSAASIEFAPLLVASAFSLAALLLLGPGAYSVDARRYGRRVILLAPRSPDRGMRD